MKYLKTVLLKLVNNRIVLNIGIVSSITLIVKIVSFFKESLSASSFGLSISLDTFYLAILIPSFIQNVFITAITNLFIPNYIAELKDGTNSGSFQTYVLVSILCLTTALTIIAFIFINFFLEFFFPGHPSHYYSLIRSQFYIVLPCIFIWGYISYFGGLLEIKSKFLLSTLSQFSVPIITIIFLLFLKSQLGIYTLVLGMTIGSTISLLYLWFLCRKFGLISLGPLIESDNIRMMKNQYMPKVTSGLLVGINPFIDQFFAAQLVAGSISAINYGTKIPAFFIGIIVIGIGNVLLPHFSRLITTDLKVAFKQLFKILVLVFFVMASVVGIVILFSEDIVSLLFERNNFTSRDTLIVSRLQIIALIYVPFYICTNIIIKFLTAINKNVFMAWISFIKLVINIVLNLILIEYFEVYGLVLATTIMFIISSIIYFSYTYKLYLKSFNSRFD